MPDGQPVSVPDFCPTCGVYWECECAASLTPEATARFIPELPPDPLGDELMRRFMENAHPGFALPTGNRRDAP